MEKFRKITFFVLIIVFLTIFLVCGLKVGQYILDARQQSSAYEDLASRVEAARNQAATATSPNKSTTPRNPEDGEIDATIETEPMLLPELEELLALNPDTVGWLTIPDTKINYPVMQTPDRPDYYLRRNFEGENNSHGALYINENCDVHKPSDNVTIFGHNMKNGSMFADLNKFKNEGFLEAHPTFSFDTLYRRGTYEIFAVFTTTASVGEGFSYHNFIDAYDEADFDNFISLCKGLSFYDTGITPTYGDKILCLSTCEYSQVNGRLVVAARLVP